MEAQKNPGCTWRSTKLWQRSKETVLNQFQLGEKSFSKIMKFPNEKQLLAYYLQNVWRILICRIQCMKVNLHSYLATKACSASRMWDFHCYSKIKKLRRCRSSSREWLLSKRDTLSRRNLSLPSTLMKITTLGTTLMTKILKNQTTATLSHLK